MKILTKYKDYYDYLSGIYGVDPKLILDRREGFGNNIYLDGKIELFICGRKIEGYKKDGIIYYGNDLLQFEKKPKYTPIRDKPNYKHVIISENKYHAYQSEYYALEPISGDYNKDCPILYKNVRDFIKFPKLAELDLATFLPPEQIYQWLTQWLGEQIDKQLEVKDNLSNIQKLENKGFNKTTSFRPNIKQ